MVNSKYIGKIYEGYEVVNCYLKNNYRKAYANSKVEPHNAYNYTLVNYDKRHSLTISGNQLRQLNNGTRTIDAMLHNEAKCSKNSQINEYKKELKHE